MSKLDDLECDVEILRDVVFQIEQDMKALAQELARVKELLEGVRQSVKEPKLEPKGRHH
jgi:hypothetical protein